MNGEPKMVGEMDEKILTLHAKFHTGAFVDCRQCRAVIEIVDEASSDGGRNLAESPAEYRPQLGRPPKPMPERIDADPEDIAWAELNTPPKKDWRYLRESGEDGPSSPAISQLREYPI